MSENGKLLIMRGLARSVEQYYRLGYGRGDLRLIAWGKEARIVEWVLDEEFPQEMLECAGFANAESLIKLLDGQPEGKFLILTDGFHSRDDMKALKSWKDKLLPDTLRIIKIGADADTRLKGADVFVPEDFFAVLNGWTEGSAA